MWYFFENRTQKTKNQIPLSIYVSKNLRFRAHWHTELELAFVEAGDIWIGINNDRRNLVAGQFAISLSGDIHYYESISPSRVIILIFKPEFFGLAANWPDTRQLASSFFTDQEQNQKIKVILDEILAEHKKREAFYELFIRAKVLELCGAILRYLPNQPVTQNQDRSFSQHKAMQDILFYIENNFTEEITLNSLAEQFRIDPYNLSKAFNSITGSNLRTYINTLRIAKAEQLIMTTSKPMIEIAFECGFNSVRTFNRVYKNITGIAPSAKRLPNTLEKSH